MTRRIVQLCSLALFLLLIALSMWSISPHLQVEAFLELDPLLSLSAAIASRSWIPALVSSGMLLAATLLLGRFFCAWLCPLGTCLELGDRLLSNKRLFGPLHRRRWPNAAMKGRWLKYLLLIAILAAAIGGQNLVWTADPLAWSTRIVTYGLWPPVAALANAILDLIRPMMEHWGLFELARFELHQPSFSAAGVIALSFLAGLLALGLLQRRLWCRCLCPLGALLAIFSRFSPLRRLVDERCDHDGRCHRRCETGAIPAADERSYSPSECIMCQRCVPDCHLCITRFGLARPKETQTVDIDLNRRQLLAGIGASIGLTGALVLSSRTVPASPANSPIRPPSSIPERAFGATCIRCGQCIKTCPTGCLQPSLAAGGLAGLMTPVAVMRIGACDPNCTACTAVCPTEAIRPLSASEKRYARLGTARVDHDRCIAWSQGRHCLVCDEFCPYGAIEWSEGSSGIRRPHVVTERCNGCGNCEKVCPVEGAAAIRVSAAGQVRIARGSIRAAAHQAGYRPVDWKDFGP